MWTRRSRFSCGRPKDETQMKITRRHTDSLFLNESAGGGKGGNKLWVPPIAPVSQTVCVRISGCARRRRRKSSVINRGGNLKRHGGVWQWKTWMALRKCWSIISTKSWSLRRTVSHVQHYTAFFVVSHKLSSVSRQVGIDLFFSLACHHSEDRFTRRNRSLRQDLKTFGD